MAHFYFLFLQLLVLLFIITECKGSQQVTTMSGPQGGTAFLPCINASVIDAATCYRVQWMKQMEVILTRPRTTKFQDANRVKWEDDGNRQMSLSLTDLQKSDEGLYTCEIWKGWDRILVKNISLKVKGCTFLATVKAAPNTTAILSCQVDVTPGDQRPSNMSWSKIIGGKPVPLSSNRVQINGRSLTIQSVNVFDSGWYICKDMLEKSERCFDINLKVQEGADVIATTVPVPVSVTTTAQVTTTANPEEFQCVKEDRGDSSTAVVSSVITGIAIAAAALVGLFTYRRCNALKPRADAPRQSWLDYEIVDVKPSEGHTNLRVNSLYQDLEDENMRTFDY